VSAGGQHHALVEYQLAPEAEAGALRCAAFLNRYYGEGGQLGDLNDPMHTITTKARLALVTVKGEPWVIVDVCLRMLTPRELANATSFPPQYVIDRGHDGRIFSKEKQVGMIGNAVPPLLQQAVTAANYNEDNLRLAA
jgi:DNA (cytosine-5)-methyltransferase 1